MRLLYSLALYAALALTANAALADTAQLEALRQGDMSKLNFWATWCAPCRIEMPTLAKLQAELGSLDFAVVSVATLRNTVPGVKRFFRQEKIDTLPLLIDSHARLAHRLAIAGLPVTLIVDPEGRDIARLIGEADWSSESAQAIFKALLAERQPSNE